MTTAKFVAFEFSGFNGLATPVRVELDDRTVLVGKNGAGKSVILNAIERGAASALGKMHIGLVFQEVGHVPHWKVECRVSGRKLAYEWWIEQKRMPSDSPSRQSFVLSWKERCVDLGSGDELWRVSDGRVSTAAQADVRLPEYVGVLGLEGESLITEAGWISKELGGIGIIHAGIPRADLQASESVLLERKSDEEPWTAQGRLQGLAARIANMSEKTPDQFEEVVGILRRLKLVDNVELARIGVGEALYGILAFDGKQLTHLSDGTVRIVEIVSRIVDPKVRLLLLEEPETALHPGLMDRLLHELYAYSQEKQLVMSTHSPRLVDCVEPSELRLVERTGQASNVRSLDAEEAQRVNEYLEDGVLGDYVFDLESDEE